MLSFLFKYASKITFVLWCSAFGSILLGLMLENNFLKFVCITLLICLGVFVSIYVAFNGNHKDNTRSDK